MNNVNLHQLTPEFKTALIGYLNQHLIEAEVRDQEVEPIFDWDEESFPVRFFTN